MPSGNHLPSAWHIRLEGPKSSNPRSQAYDATTPGRSSGAEKVSEEWAGAPGYPQDNTAIYQEKLNLKSFKIKYLNVTREWCDNDACIKWTQTDSKHFVWLCRIQTHKINTNFPPVDFTINFELA